MAFYIFQEKTWYIVPFAAIRQRLAGGACPERRRRDRALKVPFWKERSKSVGGWATCGASAAVRQASGICLEYYAPEKTTITTVRYYSIKTINDCITFTCAVCKYSVTILDFSSQNGSRRTQAARVMNEHAAAVHRHSLPIGPPSAQLLPTH